MTATATATATDFSELDSLHVRDLVKLGERDRHNSATSMKKKDKKGRSKRTDRKLSHSCTVNGSSRKEIDSKEHKSMSRKSSSTSISSIRDELPPAPPAPLDDPKRHNNHSQRMDGSSKSHGSTRRKDSARIIGRSSKVDQVAAISMKDGSDLTTSTTGTVGTTSSNSKDSASYKAVKYEDIVLNPATITNIIAVMPDKSDPSLRDSSGNATASTKLRAARKEQAVASAMKDVSGTTSQSRTAERVSRKDRRQKSKSHDGTKSDALRRTQTDSSGGSREGINLGNIANTAGAEFRRTRSDDSNGAPLTHRRDLRATTSSGSPKKKMLQPKDLYAGMDESSQQYDHARRRHIDDNEGCGDKEGMDDSTMQDVSTISTSRRTRKGRIVPPPPPPPVDSPETARRKSKLAKAKKLKQRQSNTGGALKVTPSPPKTKISKRRSKVSHLTNDLL